MARMVRKIQSSFVNGSFLLAIKVPSYYAYYRELEVAWPQFALPPPPLSIVWFRMSSTEGPPSNIEVVVPPSNPTPNTSFVLSAYLMAIVLAYLAPLTQLSTGALALTS